MLKEPEIKLFGRKISLPEQGAAEAGGERSIENSNGSGCDRCFEEEESGREEKQEQIDEELAEGEVCDTSTENEDDRNPSQKSNTPSGGDQKNSPADDDVESENKQKSDNEATKGLKKPDKILACPRCSSMDTKFCYYNNYNVNQPRHFCKSCQRYWTAGGTMRNVPVGAGRRKTKNSAPHCRHIIISDPHHTTLDFRPNATVLSFGKDETAASGNPAPTAASAAAMPPIPPVGGGQNGFQHTNMNGFPCIPGVPWPFPWSSAVPLPAVFPAGYPVPYYLLSSGGWNVPWVSPAVSETAALAAGSSPTSTLGKHPRSGELQSPAMAEGGEEQRSKKSSIVVPKTLRINDPEEAARSSIWSTLGINYDSVSREGLFKALQPKKQSTAAATAASSFMQANPAAMSRSLKFQEAA